MVKCLECGGRTLEKQGHCNVLCYAQPVCTFRIKSAEKGCKRHLVQLKACKQKILLLRSWKELLGEES